MRAREASGLMLEEGATDRGGVDELTKEFLAESLEGLDRMDQCLTELESRPADAELLGEIFRAVHTIKGTTGFLGFTRLEKLAHAGENLLGSLRDGKLSATPEIVDGMLRLMDGLRTILRLIETSGREGERTTDNDDALIEGLRRLNENESAGDGDEDAHPDSGLPNVSLAGSTEKTLRIRLDVLNRMVNLVGELVLTRNQILQRQLDASTFPELARRLDSVTADLRETVMQARMQPVGHLFGKFPRMMRDLARSCGKNVRIEFSGQETGLDKSLLEAIKDPLTHALRNAIDHGIESPRERLLAGKPAQGVVKMRARHQSGSVVIEIEDDGAGISRSRVLGKAIERGLVSEERAAAMNDHEIQQILFLPGFSTAAKVSHVSGRGVGMDVVRTNVEKAGGNIEVDSVEGAGTVLRLRVPLTLAIVPALVVRSGGHSFCLPQGSLAELVYVPAGEATQAVEWIGAAPLYRLREAMLPLVHLDELLELAPRGAARTKGFYLAVLELDGVRFGLVVDELLAPEEIVVKPIAAALREIGLYSGATVLGNGMLALILDVAATAARAGVTAMAERVDAEVESGLPFEEEPSFLIFERGSREVFGRAARERMALPLHAVERIESLPAGAVEYAEGRAVLQYRSELLPLEDACGALEEMSRDEIVEDEMLTVLICRRPAGQRVGLLVRAVLDVAKGSMLADDVAMWEVPLALVNKRLTALYPTFVERAALREVA